MERKLVAIMNQLKNKEWEPDWNCEPWAGAHMSVVEQPYTELPHYDEVVVVTKNVAHISSMVYALKDACIDWLDSFNKFEFYGEIGSAAKNSIENNETLEDTLLSMVMCAKALENKFNRYYYFAYGSNMDIEQMKHRCPCSVEAGVALVNGYRFALDEAGVATIIADKSEHIEGLLWLVTPDDIMSLDRYEGVAAGAYRKEYIDVRQNGVRQQALVYVSCRPLWDGITRREGYLERICSAATALKLTPEYIQMLQTY